MHADDIDMALLLVIHGQQKMQKFKGAKMTTVGCQGFLLLMLFFLGKRGLN